MQRASLRVFGLVLLLNLAAYGQSLGEVARENREKQSLEGPSATKPIVITNTDLQKEHTANEESNDVPSSGDRSPGNKTVRTGPAEQHSSELRAAEKWKRQILAQEDKIADLQDRIDQLNASIRSSKGTAQFETPTSRYEVRQLDRIAETTLQLNSQKRKLVEMQESARRAGMHTTVYDP
jgi:hypothetical protein